MRKSRSILLASADDDSSGGMADALRAAGYTVLVAPVASEVVKLALDHNPAVAIVDLELAGLSGVSVIEILQRVRPNLPLVVLSGDASIEVGRRILELGVFYFLLKPVNFGEVQAAVESAMTPRRSQGAVA